jgi:predicted DsbA family dithiol-disulfide isomerase
MANQLKASYQQHLQLFETLQSQPQDSFQLDSFRQLLKGIGIREEAIEPVLFDSDIPKQLKRQLNLLEKFSISSVPTIIFKGQYVITAEQAKTPAHLLAILEFLESQTL